MRWRRWRIEELVNDAPNHVYDGFLTRRHAALFTRRKALHAFVIFRQQDRSSFDDAIKGGWQRTP